MDDLLQIGIITSTHGIRGEVKVFPTTDDNARFKNLKECYLEYKNEQLPVKVQGVKFFKNMVIVKFQGIDNINDVEIYKNCRLFVDREHAVALEEDEFFMADLVGLKVEKEDGTPLGILTEIIPTGSNDVYVVRNEENKEWLFPALKECILQVDIDNEKMVVRFMKGMEE